MELRHLRYFLAVADAGSMTEGARRLSVAQSPLSQQIRQLEQRLGVTLFERGRGRAAQLTQAGQVLYGRAQQVMAALEEASEEVREVATGRSGRLRFGAVPSIAAHLTEPLRGFGRRFPQASVSFHEAGAERLVGELLGGELDMVLVRLPIPPADVEVRVLWEEEFFLAVPPDHPLAGRGTVRLAEVAHERFVAFDRRSTWYLFQLIETACEKEGFRPRVVCEGPSFATVGRLVGAGYGVSVLPRSAVEPLRSPRPVTVAITGRPVVTAIAGLSRRHSVPSQLSAAWLDHLEEWAGHGGPIATRHTRAAAALEPFAPALRISRG
jgi:LysR family transcriptional regulator, hydrogen peroxide-inducible genes activator